MTIVRRSTVALLCGILLGAAGCTDGYGYSGVSMGYGGGGYYGDPLYAGGYGYTPSYYGWYNDYYYPGTGVYVYDRYRQPRRWSDAQRRYWQGRPGYGNPQVRNNWQDFGRDVRRERRDFRGDVRDSRQAYRAGTITRDQFQQQRQAARQEYRGDVRQDYRDLRRANRAEGVRTPRPNGAFSPRPGGGGGWRGRGRRP